MTTPGPQNKPPLAARRRGNFPKTEPSELLGFLTAQANGTLPFAWKLAMDGSPDRSEKLRSGSR